MAQSLARIYIHLIFHIKSTSPKIEEKDWERVHSYIGQLVNITGCQVVKVGGVEDHIHILLRLSKDVSIAHVTQEVKRNSSRWIKSIAPCYRLFKWQSGYGAFSVSQSLVERTEQYIIRQKNHHQKHGFEEEYLSFLKVYGVDYDEKYLFSD